MSLQSLLVLLSALQGLDQPSAPSNKRDMGLTVHAQDQHPTLPLTMQEQSRINTQQCHEPCSSNILLHSKLSVVCWCCGAAKSGAMSMSSAPKQELAKLGFGQQHGWAHREVTNSMGEDCTRTTAQCPDG